MNKFLPIVGAAMLAGCGSVCNGSCVLKIPAGRRFLTEPMKLTAADSNVTIVGEPGAVLDGSVKLERFAPDAQGVWHARVPAGVVADQLFVNDRRATPARTPNRFAFHMAEPVGEWKEPISGRVQNLAARGFRVAASEAKLIEAIPAAEREGMRLFVYTSWDTFTMPFDWYDAEGRVICGKGKGRNALFRFGARCPRYRLENYRGALDEPGEWFFDRVSGEVLYLPLPDEKPETTVAFVPVTETLLEVQGATNVTVRNLVFEHAAWRHPGEVKNGQAAMSVKSFAVHVVDSENVVFEDCRVRHVGAHALCFQGGTSRCRVSRCLFEDLGAGGVYIGDPTWKKESGDAALTKFVTVEDSIFRDGGVTLPGAVGVWLGQVHDCAVVHNDISYFRYTGVSAGWTWGSTRETPVARNRISYNHLHHLCLGELNDMGGIYTLGISTDSEEIGNWIHDIASYPWSISPAWGIYTDEGSTGILIASNLVENVRDGAIHQNYGNANRFVNNIFANCGKGRSFIWRSIPSKDQATFSLTNNIFYTTDCSTKAFWKYDYFGECPVRGFDAKDVPADGNVWWFGGEPAQDAFNFGDWATWRAEGHDAHGMTADPGFVDAANGDWRLKPDSPALKAGFRPFDWRQSGVRGDAAWKREAESFRRPPFEDYPEPPRWLRDADRFGFEDGRPVEIILAGIRGKGVQTTTKAVRSGKMALEIADAVLSGPQAFQPHFYMSTPGATGIRFGYSFAADEKACVTMQTRQWGVAGKPYATGVHLTFKNGKLSVNGRSLVTLKPLQWCDLVFEADFSAGCVPTWKVTATPQGGSPVIQQVSSAEDECLRMNWVGWMSECQERACWYFDDFWYDIRR